MKKKILSLFAGLVLAQTAWGQDVQQPTMEDFASMLASPVGQNGVTAKWIEFYDGQDFATQMPHLGSSTVLNTVPPSYEDWRAINIMGRGPVEGFVDLSRQRTAMATGQFSEIYQFPNATDLKELGATTGSSEFIFDGLTGAQNFLNEGSQQLVGCTVVYVVFEGKEICIRSCSDSNDIGEAFGFRQ